MFLFIFLVFFCGLYEVLKLYNVYPVWSIPPPSRIHGGEDAPEGYAVHMVALLAGDRVVCGGSLATRRHVLTAAHCISPFVVNDVLVLTFHGRVGSNIWHSGGVRVEFHQHYIHPEWDEDLIKFDVGILVLTEELVFNELVGKINLSYDWVGGEEEMYVTGWGTTEWRQIGDAVQLAPTPDELQLLHVQTLSPEQCAASIASSPQWAAIAPPIEPRVEICALHSNDHAFGYSVGYGMCHGDSGSALVSQVNGKQIGIVSWGIPCARGAPDVYTRLYGVGDFITHVLNLN